VQPIKNMWGRGHTSYIVFCDIISAFICLSNHNIVIIEPKLIQHHKKWLIW